jgi:hypothetical protein
MPASAESRVDAFHRPGKDAPLLHRWPSYDVVDADLVPGERAQAGGITEAACESSGPRSLPQMECEPQRQRRQGVGRTVQGVPEGCQRSAHRLHESLDSSRRHACDQQPGDGLSAMAAALQGLLT